MKRIFIGGLGRSGTTITLNALYNHHQVLAFPVETKFLVEEDGFAELIPALTTDFSVAAAPVAIERFEFLLRCLVTGDQPSKFTQQHDIPITLFNNYTAAVDDLLALVKSRYYFEDPGPLLAATRRFADATFDAAATAHGYSVWAEKTPSNIWKLDFLRALWPDCYIVHCIRDPRDILLSFMEREWLPSDLIQALTIFESTVAALLRVRRAQRPGPQWMEMRLEELLRDTPGTLDILATSLSLEPFREEAKQAVADAIEKYYAGKSPSSLQLTTWERDLIVNRLRPAVAELGYSENWNGPYAR